MQRWKNAGVGPRSALVAGLALGVTSLTLYQSAYAVAPPYPGPPGLPGIPPGPSLGCNNGGTTNQTWVSGFNPLSIVHFKVDNRPAGTAQAQSQSGAVPIVITFLTGQVQVDANAPVPVTPGTNYLVVEGPKTTGSGTTITVGLKLAFSTPRAGTDRCVTTPTPPPTAPVTQVPPQVSTTFPSLTTVHRFYPTTLAKVLETPLAISPNKVILESSLIAGVLAAAMCAGSLGAMWGGSAREAPAALLLPVVPSEPSDEPGPSPSAPTEPDAPLTPGPTPSGGVRDEPTEAAGDTTPAPPSSDPPPEPPTPEPSTPEPPPSAPSTGAPSAAPRPTPNGATQAGAHAFVRRPPDSTQGVT